MMKRDKILLKKCLQELERLEAESPGVTCFGIADETSAYLRAAMNPQINCTVFIEPGDRCYSCGDMATESRITHWSILRLCECCVRAYDAGSKDQSTYHGCMSLHDRGADPEGGIPAQLPSGIYEDQEWAIP